MCDVRKMMTAYQPQQGMHPGMPPHGHPGMTPGQPMTPAQMQQMGHQVSGPGAPHVSQPGAMMGMQMGANAMGGPGMGGQHPGGQMGGMPGQQMGGQSMAGGTPNAHAMNHPNPQAAMMHQQQMQQQSESFPFFSCLLCACDCDFPSVSESNPPLKQCRSPAIFTQLRYPARRIRYGFRR